MAAQIELLYKSPLAFFSNIINAVIVAAVLWEVYPRAAMLAWLGLMLAAVLLRFMIWRRYRASPNNEQDAPFWGRLFTLGSAAAGVLWATASSAIFMVESIVYHAFVGFVIAGMTAGGVAALSVHRPAFYAFFIPSVVPLAVTYLIHGEVVHVAMGVMTLLYGFMINVIAQNFNNSLAETLTLQIRNEELVQKLSVAHDAALAASHAKSKFLAIMSHELRTPLNAILGFAEILKFQTFGPLGNLRYQEYVADIYESGTHLLDLINEVLDFSKAEAGNLTLSEDEVELASVIRRCAAMVSKQAASKEIELKVDVPENLPWIYADALKLRQILLNLLSNAVKFTPAGGQVTLTARVRPDEAVAIAVTDTGIGMIPDDIPKALSPFVQIDDQLSRMYPGTGLGLPLAKRLVELHGGTLRLESEKAVGSKVSVTLPPGRTMGKKRVAV